eukprot:4167768-Pyramimonas_sp.AAC.1
MQQPGGEHGASAPTEMPTGATFEAPEVGGYIAPLLQERMMLHLDANGFLQTAILSGDRQAVEAGAR